MTLTPPRRKPLPDRVKAVVVVLEAARRKERFEWRALLDELLAKLGIKEGDIDWSHEPALGLRAINADGSDYKPSQHDPNFIFIRARPVHDQITFKDNGTGRGDLTAIAHVRRGAAQHQDHVQRMDAKGGGGPAPKPTRKHRIPSRPFGKQHRPLRSRNDLRRR